MPVLVGNGFYLSTALAAGGAAANGTVLSWSDLGETLDIRTNSNLAGQNSNMNIGDGFVVDTDDDGSFADEAATTQIDNDRYSNSTVTYADGSTTNLTLELVTLSDGSQVIVGADNTVGFINAAASQISSITLGTFNNTFNNYYNQRNFTNTITNTIVCFDDKTLIQTPSGHQEIGTMKAGDRVVTVDEGAQKIAWIGKRTLSSAQLVAFPHLKPVRIRADALGGGVPRRDLLVSPQHRILLVSKVAERMFGQEEIFVPAIKLVGVEGIEQVTSCAPVTYVHMLFEAHQIVFANGAMAESLYTGPQALEALSDVARNEIFEIFPELKSNSRATPLTRVAIQKRTQVDDLLARHKKNRKQLVLHPC